MIGTMIRRRMDGALTIRLLIQIGLQDVIEWVLDILGCYICMGSLVVSNKSINHG